jgi:hypothetical protein
MAQSHIQAAIRVKLEATYGVEETLAAADAILVTRLEETPLDGDTISRDLVRPYLGGQPSTFTSRRLTVGFDVELQGRGVAGQAPAWGKLLRACKLQEVAVAAARTQAPVPVGTPTGAFTSVAAAAFTGTAPRSVRLTCTTAGGSGVAAFTVSSAGMFGQAAASTPGVVMTSGSPFALGVGAATITPTITTSFAVGDTFDIALLPPAIEYQPIGGPGDSCTIWINRGSMRYRGVGCRGTVSVDLTAQQNPKLKFQFTGLFQAISADSMPTVDFTAFQAPLHVSTTSTPHLSLLGFKPKARSLMVDLKGDVQPRLLVGNETIEVVDRMPDGSANIELPTIAEFDLFQRASVSAAGELRVLHGDAPGRIIEIAGPRVQLGKPTTREEQKVIMAEVPLSFVPVAGNDELVLRAY